MYKLKSIFSKYSIIKNGIISEMLQLRKQDIKDSRELEYGNAVLKPNI